MVGRALDRDGSRSAGRGRHGRSGDRGRGAYRWAYDSAVRPMNRHLRSIVVAAMALGLCLAAGGPVLAECMDQRNRWPTFAEVAPSAQRIVVGTVGGDLHGYASSPWFDLRVDEVLRGSSPATVEIRRLVSGVPLTGEQSCRDDAVLYARRGDVIAIAYDGRLAGVAGPVTTVAWVRGDPDPFVVGAQRLTLAAVRNLASLPQTATAPFGDPGGGDPGDPLRDVLLLVAAGGGGWMTLRRLAR